MTTRVRNRSLAKSRLIVSAAGLVVIASGWLVLRGGESGATDPVPSGASAAWSRLSPEQRAGQRVVGGFIGRRPPRELRQAIHRGRIGGIILFSQNLGSRRQIRRLTHTLQKIRRPAGLGGMPLPVMVDQEGGLVKRLAGAPKFSAAQMGRRGAAVARRQGVMTGRNLVNAGFNLDLAPVLDVARRGGTIDETWRSFGHTPARVSKVGVAFADGLQSTGVAATAKHFPGLGAARINTDDAVQRIRLSKSRLRHTDLPPFRKFIAGGGRLVMVGNAIYPAFGGKPAAFSRRIVTGELRRRLGFNGVAITDALGATAATAYGGPGRTAVAAARAGMDLMLYGDWQSALRGQRALARKYRAGKLGHSAFRQSVNRILTLRAGFGHSR